MSELGERLRRERKRRGERQVDAAERFGVSQATLHRWESGAHRPDVNQYGAVADYLGATLDEVYGLAMGPNQAPTSLAGVQAEVDGLRRELAQLSERLSTALTRIDQLEHRVPVNGE